MKETFLFMLMIFGFVVALCLLAVGISVFCFRSADKEFHRDEKQYYRQMNKLIKEMKKLNIRPYKHLPFKIGEKLYVRPFQDYYETYCEGYEIKKDNKFYILLKGYGRYPVNTYGICFWSDKNLPHKKTIQIKRRKY